MKTGVGVDEEGSPVVEMTSVGAEGEALVGLIVSFMPGDTVIGATVVSIMTEGLDVGGYEDGASVDEIEGLMLGASVSAVGESFGFDLSSFAITCTGRATHRKRSAILHPSFIVV